MNRKDEIQGNFIISALFVSFLSFFSFQAYTAVVNGDFEMSEPNSLGAVPIGWTTKNYARVHEAYTPIFERGQQVSWSFESNRVLPAKGASFLVLSTGDIGADSSITFANAMQLINFKKGDTLRGKYFFGTGDYLGWNDYAEIKLIPFDPNSGKRTMTVTNIDVQMVGDFSSTDGWQTFSHEFTAAQAGMYYLFFGVYDKTDAIYKTYLMIDDVEVGPVPKAADFNADGKVDYVDLSIFANVLYQDCTDPNAICTYMDITGNEVSYDFDQDQTITPSDMTPLGDNWLWKPPAEPTR